MLLSDAPSVRVIDVDFNLYCELDAYQSLSLTRGFSAPGSFKLTLPAGRMTAGINPGRYVLCGDYCGLIERVRYEEGGEVTLMTISGCEAGGILSTRICMPPAGSAYDEITAAPGECMAALVTHNAIAPADARRALKLELGEVAAGGQVITAKVRYDVLADKLHEIGDAHGMGWRIRADIDRCKWVLDIYSGRDITAGKPDDALSPMIFSPQLDNLTAASYEHSISGACNCAIVAGQGEGVDRAVVTVYTDADARGENLREMMVDARDVKQDADLPERGKEKLAARAETNVLSGTAAVVCVRDYGTRWRLGDMVTVRHDDWGVSMDARITQTTISYGADTQLEVKLGEGELTLMRIIEREIGDLKTGISV